MRTKLKAVTKIVVKKPARLLDKPVNGVYPFEYTNEANTDIRATFAKYGFVARGK